MADRSVIYECSTPLGLATLAEIVDREPRDQRRHRVLLVSINGRYPEVDDWFRESPRLRELASETFDRVISLNDLIWPTHPSEWAWQGSWTGHHQVWLDTLGVERVDELVVESIQVPPALSLARLFSAAVLRIYSDGLMAYSPTRVRLPGGVLDRIDTLHCVDYLQGVVPLLASEAGPRVDFIDPDTVVRRMTTRDSASGTSGSKSTIVVLGQALASHGILTENDEVELYVSTMTALARVFGFDAIRFKAHPTVASSLTQAVARRFEAAVGGVLEVVGGTSPLEEVIEQIDPAALVGFFSTGLITVGRHFDIPVFQARAAELFQQLSPYANSNRIPALISALVLPDVERLLAVGRERKAGVTVDAVARDATSGFSPDRRLLEQAILAVGVTMQPDLLDFRAKEVQAFMRSPNWARIEPFMTCRDDHLVETDQYGALGPHAIRRAALRATNAVVGRVLSPRLMTKFDQDPRRFFSDSSNEWVRRIGLVYDGLLLDEDDSEG